MASARAFFVDDDLDDDEEQSFSDLEENYEEDEELLGEEDLNSPSTSRIAAAAVSAKSVSAIPAVPLAVPAASAVTVASVPMDLAGSDLKRQRIGDAVVERKPPPPPPPPQLDESRRLFQRLWTDEDEIGLLQGFLDYTTQRGNANSHHHDTALFYDQIKSKLQLDFNKNQLVEKLRRLKKKFRNLMTKITSGKDVSFKSPHDQATFEISSRIWSNEFSKPGVSAVEDTVLDEDEGNANLVPLNDDYGEKKTPKSRKRSRSKPPGVKIEENRLMNDAILANNSNCNGNVDNVAATSGGLRSDGNVAGLIEETVKSSLSPLFKELLGNGTGGGFGFGLRGYGSLPMNAMPLHFSGSSSFGGGEIADERWRKQQILELEVYSKRLDLVQDQIKAALDELRSTGG